MKYCRKVRIMYGYIKTFAPELRVREQEYYRAAYCGLCRTMGKCTGQCSRFTLSYDFTFLSLIRLALAQQEIVIRPRRCAAHPLRKKLMADPHEAFAFCAYASALIAYYKVADDKKDETGHRRRKATVASPYAKHLRKKALKAGYADMDAEIKASMDAISRLEAERVPSADQPAELFGDLMAYLVSYGFEGDTARIGKMLGHHLGRWIYLADAVDDYTDDIAKGRYNPFAALWQGGDMDAARKDNLSRALMAELVRMESAMDLADPGDTEKSNLWGCLRNVLYLGMPATAEQILYPEKRREMEENIKSIQNKHTENTKRKVKNHEKSL